MTDQASAKELAGGDLSDVIIAAVVAVAIFLALGWIAYAYKTGEYMALLLLTGLVGASAGWVAGILASPYNPAEKGAFAELGKLIYGFLSGYVISKIDPLVTEMLKPSTGQASDERSLVFLAFLLTACMVAAAVTYVSRTYWIVTAQKAA